MPCLPGSPPAPGVDEVVEYQIQRRDNDGVWQVVDTAPAGPAPSYLLNTDADLHLQSVRIRVVPVDANGPVLRARSATRIQNEVSALELTRTGLRSYEAYLGVRPLPDTTAATLELDKGTVVNGSPTSTPVGPVAPGSTTPITFDQADDGKGPFVAGRIQIQGRTGSIQMAWQNEPIGAASAPRDIAVSQSARRQRACHLAAVRVRRTDGVPGVPGDRRVLQPLWAGGRDDPGGRGTRNSWTRWSRSPAAGRTSSTASPH